MSHTCQLCHKPMIKNVHNQLYHPECKKLKNVEYARKANASKRPGDNKKQCACGCGKWFEKNSNVQKYYSKRCYRKINNQQCQERKKQRPKSEIIETAWAVPSPPVVRKFTKTIHRIFFEIRNYA